MIEGTRYTFDVYGLYNGLFVMSDRQSGSVWTHYSGSILTGPLAESGKRLTIQPLIHTTWAEWQELHPGTLVLDWYPEFANRYYDMQPGRAGLGPEFQETLLHSDNRLAENELVLGTNIGNAYRAYVLADFADGLEVINDTLNGVPVVVVLDGSLDFGLAFLATFGGEVLTFSTDGESILDDKGTTWNLSGAAIGGPLTDSQLSYVTSFVTEWYGWAAYHPETSIYGH